VVVKAPEGRIMVVGSLLNKQSKSGIRNPELGIRNQELGIRNQESGIRNPELGIRN